MYLNKKEIINLLNSRTDLTDNIKIEEIKIDPAKDDVFIKGKRWIESEGIAAIDGDIAITIPKDQIGLIPIEVTKDGITTSIE